jgi:hypothetical protein
LNSLTRFPKIPREKYLRKRPGKNIGHIGNQSFKLKYSRNYG